MPLSEHEQRLLDDIEKALYAEDPKFAASVRTVKRRGPGRRWIAVATFGVIVGLGLVLLGLLIKNPIPAVAGFVLVVAAIVYGAMAVKAGPIPADASSLSDSGSGSGRRGAKAPATGIRARMEDRMRKRFEENS